MSFSLQIDDQGLVEFDLSAILDPFDFNQFMLCPKTKLMASGPITSWEINGEAVDTVSDFIFWGSKITADGDCSHEIKRHPLKR